MQTLYSTSLVSKEEAERQLALYATIPQAKLTHHEREALAIYDAIASDSGKLIQLSAALKAGDSRRDRLTTLPKVALAPIGAQTVTVTISIERDRDAGWGHRIHHTRYSVPGWAVEAPRIFFHKDQATYATGSAKAIVPSIIPTARDKVEEGDLLIWEPTWTETRMEMSSRPDPDPAILRHVTGDIYRVVAAWDLTNVERLVLGGT